jgi:hypothetical protein
MKCGEKSTSIGQLHRKLILVIFLQKSQRSIAITARTIILSNYVVWLGLLIIYARISLEVCP